MWLPLCFDHSLVSVRIAHYSEMKKQSQSGSGLKPYTDKAKSAKLNAISAKSDMPAKQQQWYLNWFCYACLILVKLELVINN